MSIHVNMSPKDVIQECLKHHAYETAISLAEIVHAEEDTEDSGTLLASAMFAAGDAASALGVLESAGHSAPPAALLFARAAIKSGRSAEAEDTLCRLVKSPAETPTRPHAHHLLGDIYYRSNRAEKAKAEWRRALELCPLLWPAYRSLAESGETELPCLVDLAKKELSIPVPDFKAETPAEKPVNRQLIIETPDPNSPLLVPLNMDSPLDMPSESLSKESADSPPLPGNVPKAPKKTRKVLGSSGLVASVGGRRSTRSARSAADENASSQAAAAGGAVGTRRSPRFSAQHENAAPARVRASARTTMGLRNNNNVAAARSQERADKAAGRQASSHRLITPSPTDELDRKDHGKDCFLDPLEHQAAIFLSLKSAQPQNEHRLLKSLEGLSRVWQFLGRLRWQEARQEIHRLPLVLRRAPTVLVEEARTHFEMADYRRAVEIFQELRRRHPWHVAGLEIYSTALWHLQSAWELSALAQSLLPTFRYRAETWCVMGNTFSLNKDHEKAIRFLERAVQLRDLPYAYTLLGHEHMAIDAPEKAAQAFRTALRLQPRHYNAFFGLGELAKRAEQLKLARFHFQSALDVNPTNPVLQCQQAEVEQALGRPREALSRLRHPATASNPLCRYHRAQLLYAAGRYSEAMVELEELKRLAPRESRVFFLAGKVLSRLGKQHLALIDYAWATELEPHLPQLPTGLPPDPDTSSLLVPSDPDSSPEAQA